MADQYTWTIVGVCVAIGACVIALIVFVIIFCCIKIKKDSNVRKRVITRKAFPDERPETPPPEPEPEPLPLPVLQPPPPQPLFIPRPIRLPPLQPPQPPPQPPPPCEPRVIIREIYRNNEDPKPAPAPVERVRRRSWAGSNDDWVLVKKIKRRNGQKRKTRSDESSSSSSSSSSSDSSDSDNERKNNRTPRLVARPAMVPVQRYAVPRLEPYDLAVSNNNGLYASGGPRVMNMVPVNPGMRLVAPVSQPTAMTPGVSGNQPGYVSVLMPQQLLQ